MQVSLHKVKSLCVVISKYRWAYGTQTINATFVHMLVGLALRPGRLCDIGYGRLMAGCDGMMGHTTTHE